MFKNIVVGYDESANSRLTLNEISNRVKGRGAHITLVHAVYSDNEEFDATRGQVDQRLTYGKEVCLKTASEFNAEYGIEMDSVVCEGMPDRVLADVAGGTHADVIAVGTHGRRGIRRILMGSVTAGLIDHAPCDVLVLNSNCKANVSGGYRHVLVAYDGSELGKKALARAVEFAEDEDHEVIVLYVIPSYQEMVGFIKTEHIKQAIYDEAEKIMDGARNAVNGKGRILGTVIQEGKPSARIVEMAAKLKSELVVMGSHGWNPVDKAIMGSTTERVILFSPCPVLVVR